MTKRKGGRQERENSSQETRNRLCLLRAKTKSKAGEVISKTQRSAECWMEAEGWQLEMERL